MGQAYDKIDASLSYDLKSKPWAAFVAQNPGIGPKVVEYVVRGGSRPSDSELVGISGGVSKPNDYALARVYEEDARRLLGGSPPPPPPGVLKWPAPILSNPTRRTLTDAASSVGVGSGGDLELDFATLSKTIGQILGYDDHVIVGGAIAGGSANSSGHIVPRENTGVAHYEGVRFTLTAPGDAYAARWRTRIVQFQNFWTEVTHAGTSFHSDGFQTQEAILEELRFWMGTFVTDYQGVFLSNEVQNQGPARSKVAKAILDHVNFRQGRHGVPSGSYLFKALPARPGADPIGPVELYEVWVEEPVSLYPSSTFRGWDGVDMKWGYFKETRRHANGQTYNFYRFSTPADKVPFGTFKGQACDDCFFRGEGGVWGHPPGTPVPTAGSGRRDFGELAGSSYVAAPNTLSLVVEPRALAAMIEAKPLAIPYETDHDVVIAKPEYPDPSLWRVTR